MFSDGVVECATNSPINNNTVPVGPVSQILLDIILHLF